MWQWQLSPNALAKTNPPAASKPRRVGEMRAYYRLDYDKSCPNRFAGRSAHDPDIAAVFRDSEAVNRALRALISAMPPGDK